MIRKLIFIGCAAVCLTGKTDRPVRAAEPSLQEFLSNHCYRCHGTEVQEAELRLDTLTAPRDSTDSNESWTRILAAIDHHEMPPAEEPQPARAARDRAVAQIIKILAASPNDPRIALRRMNRNEYENTVHDLLGIDVPLVDLLPQDGSIQGFDKVADGLSISSVLLERYLEAADTAFDASIRRIKPLPAETRRIDLMQVEENIESVKKNKGGVIEVENAFIKFTPGWPPARLDPIHPIEDGIYRCRVALWPHDPGDRTLSVAIYVGTLFGAETRSFKGIFDVTGSPQEPRIIEFTTRMDEGDAIHIVPRIWPEHITWRDKHEARPGIGIVWAETHGPLDQDFPSKAQKKLFGDTASITMVADKPIYMRHRRGVKLHIVESADPPADAERIIREFVPRAFRRPVADEMVQPYVDLVLAKLESGRTFEQAVRAGVTAVLCSPQFLLLNNHPTTDDYTIASRLSYFLWSTMPDETLLALAAEGKLSDPEVRAAQVERMIADPRCEEFVESFTGQWLDLRDIEFTTPDKKLYPEFDPLLQEAMLGETRHFFRHLLREDLSVLNFVDSDWTFLNERLAKHYGIPGIRGNDHFRKTQLPAESIRGGVLTHASLLKVTANGTSTSPVIRGSWVLDSLLGRPPQPPPPGVPAVEPDIRGATTIREQLEKHRSTASCAVCHRNIDPPGFAMEQFDAIGGERSWYRSLGEGERIPGKKTYRKGPTVQSAGILADGRQFDGFREFRQLLLEDRQVVARAIASKLLVYATGQPITAADRDVVDEVVAVSEERDYGLKTMIQAVVESDFFLK